MIAKRLSKSEHLQAAYATTGLSLLTTHNCCYFISFASNFYTFYYIFQLSSIIILATYTKPENLVLIWSQNLICYYLLLQTMNSLQPAENAQHANQDSNGFSSTSFIPEFVHRQSVKKISSGPAVTMEQKMKKMKYELFTSLQIVTPLRMKAHNLKKQLANYQFQRIQRKIQSQSLQKFGKAEQQLFRQEQNLILVLTSIMKQFRSGKQRSFYILTKKGSRVYHFEHRQSQQKEKAGQIQSVLTVCSLYQKIRPEVQSSQVQFEDKSFESYEKFLIKNQWISVFYTWLLNKILQNEKPFKSFIILANFPFPGSNTELPLELFNGVEKQKQFQYIARPVTNILGETIGQVFRIKIGGLWTVQNVRSLKQFLTQKYGNKGFDIEFECQRVTSYLAQQDDEQTWGSNKKL